MLLTHLGHASNAFGPAPFVGQKSQNTELVPVLIHEEGQGHHRQLQEADHVSEDVSEDA